MPNDTVVKVQEYKDSLILKAELLITKRFPEKIVQLNELLATPMFNERNFEEVHQDLNIPALPPVLVKNHEDNQSEDGDHPPTKRQRKDIIVSGQPVLAQQQTARTHAFSPSFVCLFVFSVFSFFLVQKATLSRSRQRKRNDRAASQSANAAKKKEYILRNKCFQRVRCCCCPIMPVVVVVARRMCACVRACVCWCTR